jgi:replication-associated recombination protein RarA
MNSVCVPKPPGYGKTTLDMVIANLTKLHFDTFSVVLAGKAELRDVLEAATGCRKLYQKKTILLVKDVLKALN